MALHRIGQFNPNYRDEAFDGQDIRGRNVYAGRSNDQIGTIDDLLVDDGGRFRYFVVNTSNWGSGKRVLLPVGRSQFDANGNHIYATGLTTRQHVENLPEYRQDMTIDHSYEDRVRSMYMDPAVEDSVPVEMSPPVEAEGVVTERKTNYRSIPAPAPVPAPAPAPAPQAYSYDTQPDLYQVNEQDHATLRLYEERLVANKSNRKVGDVTVSKHVETKAANASVPVEKEQVIIERTSARGQGRPVSPGEARFEDNAEITRMDVYEEEANIHKQAFVREEVNVRKEREQTQVQAEETVRREKLDLDVDGNPRIQR